MGRAEVAFIGFSHSVDEINAEGGVRWGLVQGWLCAWFCFECRGVHGGIDLL